MRGRNDQGIGAGGVPWEDQGPVVLQQISVCNCRSTVKRLRAFAVSAGRAEWWDAAVMHRGGAIKAPAWSSDLHSGSDSQSSQSPAD